MIAMTATHDTPRETSERAWQLASRVIDLARGLIVSDNPFLSASIGLLETKPAQLEDPFACDGKTLYVDARRVLRTFSDTREAPVHDLAHVLFHCLLLHPFVGSSVDAESWDLASDIVAEVLVEEVVGRRPGERGQRIDAALKQLDTDFGRSLTTERLYRALRDGAYPNERSQWAVLFHSDDHGLWPSSQQDSGTAQGGQSPQAAGQAQGQPDGTSSPTMQAQAGGDVAQESQEQPSDASAPSKPDSNGHDGHTSGQDSAPEAEMSDQPAGGDAGPLTESQLKEAEEAWSRASKSMRVDLETLSRNRGQGLGKLVRELEVGAHERIDYREFLRQFAVEHEDMRLSDDEFDYVFYTYGLELYGNVPLVEPLEYRSEKRIRDFAIVIDTSSSVTAKVVQEFVDATFDVLTSEGGFFAQTNIHIIQADARVQSDTKICSLADLDRWRRNIKLYGFGGTDFRPAFRYVQELRQRGEFDDLQGLVYFTDGWGIYPDRMPPYKCAFVFYDEDHRPELVPPWAIQVVLHPGEFESMSVYR